MNNALRISVYPHMKKGPQEKFARDIHKLAYKGFAGETQFKTNKELALELARKLGNGE